MTTAVDIQKAVTADCAADLDTTASASDALGQKMQALVKGAGYVTTDKPAHLGENLGNRPLSDPNKIFSRAMRAEKAWRGAIKQGVSAPEQVFKGFSPLFRSQFAAFAAQSPQSALMASWVSGLQQQLTTAVGKNISLTSPLATGLVPFDLVAPSRLIYPMLTLLRNKLPRTDGQGAAYRQKVITGISGSNTGASGGAFKDIAIAEFQGGGTFSNWPLNIPGAGTQDAVDIVVPYRFSGMSESVSWLAQFEGQGFEDVSALANLILLQEFMLGEEAAQLCATSTVLDTPANPSLVARTANSGETAITGVSTNVWVKITAVNFYGQTIAQTTGASVACTTGQVVDVQIAPVTGAMAYNVYTATGTPAAGTYYLQASHVGGLNWTIQGALPTTTATVPVSDSGTYSTLRMEGIIPTLAGHSQGSGQVYPAGWQGGYVNQSVGDTLKGSVINTALAALWAPGSYKADPAELIAESSDMTRFSNNIVSAEALTNYRLVVEQPDAGGVRAGAAVSEFVNPVTRSVIRCVVHPWLWQGTALLMTYNLTNTWSNVANAWEMRMVQDYISIGWPVIDATHRFSMYTLGCLAANAPQYSAILQGIQQTDRAGSTGTWS